MSKGFNHIVFQCYGNEGIFYECAYALLSLWQAYDGVMPGNMEIWIYTDNPAWFAAFKDCPLPLHYRQIDDATIKAWRGKIDFVHRVKIELLKDLTARHTGNILYADTDTVFTRRIDKMLEDIGSGALYMHIIEGRVCEEQNPMLKKLNRYLMAGGHQQTVKGKQLNELAMWNAGVLGFNTTHTFLLDDVLDYTDEQYPGFSKHIVEQFAFSVYLQEAGEVKAAAPYIMHYWNLKEARLVLASFFAAFKNKSWAELARYSLLLQMPALMQEKVNFFQNRSIKDKLLKKQWIPAKTDWEALSKQI